MQKKVIQKGEIIQSVDRKYLVEDTDGRFAVLSTEYQEPRMIDIMGEVKSSDTLADFIDKMRVYYDIMKKRSTTRYVFVDLNTGEVAHGVDASPPHIAGDRVRFFSVDFLIEAKNVLSLVHSEKASQELSDLQAIISIDYELNTPDEVVFGDIEKPKYKRKSKNERK